MFFNFFTAPRLWTRCPSFTVSAMTLTLVWGCFTEAGNAEDEQVVKAEFQIEYGLAPGVLRKSAAPSILGFDSSTVRIDNFYLLVREAEIHNTDGTEQHLWRGIGSGLHVDFTDKDSAAQLPFQVIPRQTFANFKLEFALPQRKNFRADTVDAEQFSDRGYIVGRWKTPGGPLPFIFALPPGSLSLFYERSTLDAWLMANTYECRFTFYASQWLDSAGLDLAKRSNDRHLRPFVLLDSTSNVDLYQKLVKKFYRSFNTSQVLNSSLIHTH
jgi:hypothetical protein